MKISENDISSTEPFGMIDGAPVKLVCTKGGLNLATMTDSKGNDTVLGAASHRAILCYSIEQKFPNYHPPIMKSEGLSFKAESHSHFLTQDLRKSGHDIYSVQEGNSIDFYVTRLDIKVATINSSIKNGQLVIDSYNLPKEFVSGVSGAVSEKALGTGLKGVKVL
jgi:hypothetical protein